MNQLIELGVFFARLGLLSFGGTEAVLGQLQRETVGNGWITSSQFTEAYALTRVAPGPSIAFITIPIGYQAAGPLGAVTALVSFIGPTALLAAVVMGIWKRAQDMDWPKTIRIAATPIALGLLGASVLTIAGPALQSPLHAGVAAAALFVTLRTTVPAPAIPFGAAVLGALLLRP